MTAYYIAYHSLILAAFLLSLVSYKQGSGKVKFLAILLLATLLVELLAERFSRYRYDFTWAYHVYVIVEYALLCLYYLETVAKERQHKAVLLSIPLFTGFSLTVSYFFYGFRSMPAINITTEGFLLFIIFVYLLSKLDSSRHPFIYQHPDFWIAVGILIFFGGMFLLTGVYTRLMKMNEAKAFELFAIINRPLNIALYSCIIIGLLCSIRKMKYTTR